jgi:hypothetical protein
MYLHSQVMYREEGAPRGWLATLHEPKPFVHLLDHVQKQAEVIQSCLCSGITG